MYTRINLYLPHSDEPLSVVFNTPEEKEEAVKYINNKLDDILEGSGYLKETCRWEFA